MRSVITPVRNTTNYIPIKCIRLLQVRLRANGRNIVDQQLPLHVASVCTPCCMLLDVVACCCAKFETGQTFRPVQTDATLLAYNSQHCWELLRPFARSLTCSREFILSNQPNFSVSLNTFFFFKVQILSNYP